jgi:hypothetical protein
MGEIRVRSETIDEDGARRPHDLDDPISVIEVPLKIREVETTIPCGFQAIWGTVDVNGEKLTATAGAGFGSGWATIEFRGKNYCFPILEVIKALLVELGVEVEE